MTGLLLAGYDPNWTPRVPVLHVAPIYVYEPEPRPPRPKKISVDTRYGKYRTLSYKSDGRWRCMDTDGMVVLKRASELLAAASK